MLRNQINPAVLFGLLLLGVALFVLSIGAQLWQEYFERSRYNSGHWEDTSDYYARLFFTFFGLALTFVALAFTLRAKWARYVLLSLFYLAGAAYTAFVIYLFYDGIGEPIWIFMGLWAMVYAVLIFCILFLNNYWMLKHWVVDYVEEERREDILDM